MVLKLDHHEAHLLVVAIALIYLTLFSGVTLFLCSNETVYWLGEEDGLIENAGALTYLLAAAVFLASAFRLKGPAGLRETSAAGSSMVLIALGVLCFICFGEEMSWGQRMFNYPVPAWLADVNRQAEWNLHNLSLFHGENADDTEKSAWERMISLGRLLFLFQLSLLTLLPILTVYSKTLRTWSERLGIPLVPWWICGLLPVQSLVAHVLYLVGAHTPMYNPDDISHTLDELKETQRAIIFLVSAVWIYSQTTASRAGGDPFSATQTTASVLAGSRRSASGS
jgi:hypothetical protein